jgi:hypothetical protein
LQDVASTGPGVTDYRRGSLKCSIVVCSRVLHDLRSFRAFLGSHCQHPPRFRHYGRSFYDYLLRFSQAPLVEALQVNLALTVQAQARRPGGLSDRQPGRRIAGAARLVVPRCPQDAAKPRLHLILAEARSELAGEIEDVTEQLP